MFGRNGHSKQCQYIRQVEETDGVLIIRLACEINHDTVPAVKDEFGRMRNQFASSNLLFDMSQVQDVDTSSIAALVDLLRHMHEHHGGERIGFVNLTEKMQALMSVYHAEGLFKSYPDEKMAVTDLKK